MTRDCKRYPWREFYKDVEKYGFTNFTFEVLEETTDLLTREQFYYDKYQPEYNFIRPCDNPLIDGKVCALSYEHYIANGCSNRKKEQYNSEYYRELFKDVQRKKGRFKAVIMSRNGVDLQTFECMQDASKWISEHTEFKGKNKTSKIKAVCDGERANAYGYQWRYVTSND